MDISTAGRFARIIRLDISKTLLSLPKVYGKIKGLSSNYYGFVSFILILPIGYFFPHLLGGGNQIVLALGNQPTTIWALVGLLVLRFVFSMVSYGSNLPGGIFLPILTLGAIIGTLYGSLLVQYVGMDPIFVKTFNFCHGWLFYCDW